MLSEDGRLVNRYDTYRDFVHGAGDDDDEALKLWQLNVTSHDTGGKIDFAKDLRGFAKAVPSPLEC